MDQSKGLNTPMPTSPEDLNVTKATSVELVTPVGAPVTPVAAPVMPVTKLEDTPAPVAPDLSEKKELINELKEQVVMPKKNYNIYLIVGLVVIVAVIVYMLTA